MSIYPKIFATIYNPILASGELAGMRALRAELLGQLSGSVLEIGAGTGLNLRHYPDSVTDLTLTEPDAAMLSKLRGAVARSGRAATVTQAPAEALPFDDNSFDAVVSTLVLCTVGDVPATLAEVRRVLRPGGSLVLVEHVRSEGARLGPFQDRVIRPWKAFACGCHCNRETMALLAGAGFDTAQVRPATWKLMPPVVRPLIAGTAGVAA